jgi:hypothetical protein
MLTRVTPNHCFCTEKSNNATSSLACFKNLNIFKYYEKRTSLLQHWRCSCKFKSRRIGSYVVFVKITEGAQKVDRSFQR